jgi:hypothetical protein
MLQSRRGFLIGAGSLLTTAFVKDARSFIDRTSQPLLASPPEVIQTLHWYGEHGEDGMGCQLALGPWTFYPPAPTWREFFVSEGIPHQTDKEIEKICSWHAIEPGEFDKPVQRRYWEDWFDCTGGPCARVYQLLEKIDLGPERNSGCGPLLEFHEGFRPGDNTFAVNAKDMLSLSLLQARLIDLKLPIKIVEGM